MKAQDLVISLILKEWLVVGSAIGLLLTSTYTKNIPTYSTQELQVLFILLVLFVATNGLQRSGLILRISQSMEQGRAIPLKLVVATFFLSMVVTNDVALIVIVPLTLALKIGRKDSVVILEALAANAGSALTPFGNPQNLYIYWFYGLHPIEFMATIAPFSLAFLFLLAVSALFITTNTELHVTSETKAVRGFAYVYCVLLLVVLLVVVHILPVPAGLSVIIFASLFDREALKVDYALLVSFFFFFGLAENLRTLLEAEIRHSGHVFMSSALMSQIISNVPTTLLFAKFTPNWQTLLWGTNVGGFGSLFGSFANLIAYRLYLTHEGSRNTAPFTWRFLLIGYVAFLLSIALYFVLHRPLGL